MLLQDPTLKDHKLVLYQPGGLFSSNSHTRLGNQPLWQWIAIPSLNCIRQHVACGVAPGVAGGVPEGFRLACDGDILDLKTCVNQELPSRKPIPYQKHILTKSPEMCGLICLLHAMHAHRSQQLHLLTIVAADATALPATPPPPHPPLLPEATGVEWRAC